MGHKLILPEDFISERLSKLRKVKNRWLDSKQSSASNNY